jgi:hypothetical protein
MGMASGKDGDGQWKVTRHVTHLSHGFRKENGKDGDGQWKRWGCLMEAMGMASGKDGGGQWKRWGCLMEAMGMASGKDGGGKWNIMEMFNGRRSQILPANGALYCGSGAVAYVVYVLLNAFVCTTGRTNHGEVS